MIGGLGKKKWFEIDSTTDCSFFSFVLLLLTDSDAILFFVSHVSLFLSIHSAAALVLVRLL